MVWDELGCRGSVASNLSWSEATPPATQLAGLDLEFAERGSIDTRRELTDPKWNMLLGVSPLDDRNIESLRTFRLNLGDVGALASLATESS